ncbi:C40 family peptidase [Geodermatophilus chilensis]|jgi:cell wall-associated NlpC family hydrolase|uniref:C40 family peptidase n=1 Tax=Geodermatophilus chilensis TaxID=2035835 RepID=UPI000C264814|nr:NlpC/P60 family protein [Geodermatophilus chilensis]
MGRNRTTSRRWSRATLAATPLSLAVAVAVLLTPATAGAAPGSAADAARLVAETSKQVATLDEQVHEAELTVAAQQQAAADAGARASQAAAVLAGYGPQLAAIAQTAGTSQSRMAAFLTSESAADVVQQMTTLDLIAAHTEGLLAEVSIAQRTAEQARADADAAAAQATASLAELERQRAEVLQRRQQYESDYARLSADEQAAVRTAVAGPTLTADVDAVVAAAPSGDVGAVLEAALAQVGDPYVWGGTGPDGFDCSGLTSHAYAAVGVSLPHSSRAQSRMGTAVSRSELQPGDLVFFGNPVIYHVGLYVGGGKMVHARETGMPVAVTTVDIGDYAGARRIL